MNSNAKILEKRVSSLKYIFYLVMIFTILVGGIANIRVQAQSVSTKWSVPVNLSHSGSTFDPNIVVDNTGTIHVIWSDQFSGTHYVFGTPNNWSVPTAVELPFQENQPDFRADSSGRIYASWRDGQDNLYFSSVRAAGFGVFSEWADPRLISASVIKMDLTIDKKGALHLLYLQNMDTATRQAGIYYQQSIDLGRSWSNPRALYLSAYFRGISPDQANVVISSSEVNSETYLYAGWDNRGRKLIIFARSVTGGTSWEPMQEIAKPDIHTGTGNPFHINITSSGDKVLLIWQDGDPLSVCTQYYQWSNDNGETWSDRNRMLEDSQGCASQNSFLYSSDNFMILESTIQERTYLLANNVTQWSNLQIQDALNNFTDPETLNQVSFGCRKIIVQGEGENLLAVGCDENSESVTTGTGGDSASTGDIWFLSRSLGSSSDWFPPPPVWSLPKAVTSDASGITSPILIADLENRLHAFWVQPIPDPTANVTTQRSMGIFYSHLTNETWSEPVPVLVSPEGDVSDPAFTVDDNGHILAVWSGGDTGKIYFSRVDPAQAGSASDWSVPKSVLNDQPLRKTTNIVVDKNGTIFIVYNVPVNEGRGIYITVSKDNGSTWTVPKKIFDGAGASWEMVGKPTLTIGYDGNLYLLWTRSLFSLNSKTQALYYSHSIDNGQSWSTGSSVVEANVVWYSILTSGGIVHRVWLEANNNRNLTWDEYSTDGGETWSKATSISSLGQNIGLGGLSVDLAGQFHLLQVSNQGSGFLTLQHWIWKEEKWNRAESWDFNEDQAVKVFSLASAISQNDTLSVIYSIADNDPKTGEVLDRVLFTSGNITLPSGLPQIQATTTVNIEKPIQSTLTPEPTALPPSQSPTPTNIPNQDSTQVSGTPLQHITASNRSLLLIGIAVFSFTVLVLLVVIVRNRVRKLRR